MACPNCGHGVTATDVMVALTNDPKAAHVHTMPSLGCGVFDAGASLIARDVAYEAFWDRVRQIVREELAAQVDQ